MGIYESVKMKRIASVRNIGRVVSSFDFELKREMNLSKKNHQLQKNN